MGIIESVQQYDLNIGPGQAQNIDVAGDRIQFLSAIDPFAQIEVRPNYAQGNISLRPGQGFRFSEQVTRWVVFNRGSVPLSGFLLIGSGDFFDQRIAGTVDVIDGGKARTLGGVAFIGSGYQAAVAAKYPHVQLWNPAGSGKRVIVEALTAASATQTSWHLRPATAALTNQQSVASKLAGGDVGVAQVRTDAYTTAQGGVVMMQGWLQASTLYEKKLNEPYILTPGSGLIVMGNNFNIDVLANFEYFEEVQ